MPTAVAVHSLRVVRTVRGLTQMELAEVVGIDRNVVGRLEAGSPPTLEIARALARALDVNVDALFPEDEDERVSAA